jgi:adenylate cyclase
MDAASVRKELERILSSSSFDASARNRRFLQYIVEETLAGRAGRLKGLTIAIDVFGRDLATFDPEHDPVVRIEAAKLRRRLEHYYLTAGREDPIRIDIPKGTYVPTFEERDGPIADPYPAPPVGELPRGPKIAVLPFLNLSGDPEQAYFAQGVTDQIVTDLARFKALLVLSTESTAKYQEASADPQQLKQELGVDYLLDGGIRRERDTIRLSSRLIDAQSGTIIWSQTYRNELTPSNVFQIQDDISQQVSATVASNYGVIAEADLAGAQRLPPKSFEAYDCVLRYYHYQKLFAPQEHAKVRACLERAVELDPDYADAWAVLANIYAQEHRFGFNPRPELYDSYERSLSAAYRAVEIEPRNPTGQLMLANALFDRHNLAAFRKAGEQAISLNPNDPEPLAHYGTRLVYMGEWERGLTLVTKAIALNPEHPQWYLDPVIYYQYQKQDYAAAWAVAESQGGSGDIWWLLFRVMILGQLGRSKEAQPLIDAALKLKGDVRERLFDMARIWNVPDAHIEHIADGLRKAGLAIEPASRPS